MDVIYERCAGLDIGKDEVTACVRTPGESGRRRQEIRTYRTFTTHLQALADWLTHEQVTQVVMEATGQYWRPVSYVLEERGFELMLVNARHVKILPGRKTDVADAAWLAELLEHGLLRGGFVPPAAIRGLGDLTLKGSISPVRGPAPLACAPLYRKELHAVLAPVLPGPPSPRSRRSPTG